MGARGQAVKDRKVGGKGGRVSRGHGRGAIAGHTARTDAVADVPQGGRLDADEIGEGLDERDSGLHEPDLSIKSTRDAKYYGRLRLNAEAALEKLITTPGVPANVRASAVRTALELVGAIGARSKDQRDQEDADAALDPRAPARRRFTISRPTPAGNPLRRRPATGSTRNSHNHADAIVAVQLAVERPRAGLAPATPVDLGRARPRPSRQGRGDCRRASSSLGQRSRDCRPGPVRARPRPC